MKNLLVSICIASTAFAMSSCRTVEKAAPLSSINGDWNIVEVSGAKVVTGEDGTLPFISFDTNTGKLSGYSGCNRMMGEFNLKAQNGSLELGQIASTRMMCADMNTENAVLGALNKVKLYKTSGSDKLILCNADKRPMAVLEKKKSDISISLLSGDWKIKEVNGEAIPSKMENQPFISFDIKEKSVHGNAGCNIIKGAFKTTDGNPKSISFPALACTMMACPDMEVEGKVLKALNEVQSFSKLSGGGIGLYNSDDALVVVLEK